MQVPTWMAFLRSKLVILGIALRLAIAPFFAHASDIVGFYSWVTEFNSGHFTPLYLPPYPLAYVFIPIATIYKYLQLWTGIQPISISSIPPSLQPPEVWNVTIVPGVLFNFVEKIPFVISDVIIAYMLYEIVKRYTSDEKLAYLCSLLWFLNPITIWISSAWGQFDSIPTLFTVLALLLVLRSRFFLASISILIGVSFKFYPIILVIPLLIYAIRSDAGAPKHHNARNYLVGILLAVVAIIPFSGQLLGYAHAFLISPNVFQSAEAAGPTYWAISLLVPTSSVSLPISLIAGGLLLLFVYYKVWKNNFENAFVDVSVIMFASIAALLLTTRYVGENFIVWIIPFAAILVVTKRLEGILFWAISILAFLFSITNSLLPYYMLADTPWIGGWLNAVMQHVQPYRVMPSGSFHPGISFGGIFLVILGVLFSLTLALSLIEALVYPGRSLIRPRAENIIGFVIRIGRSVKEKL